MTILNSSMVLAVILLLASAAPRRASAGAPYVEEPFSPAVSRRDFVRRDEAPVAVDQLLRSPDLDVQAVRAADRNKDGSIDGVYERGLLWDLAISNRIEFQPTRTVDPVLSFPRKVASLEAQRIAAVEYVQMVARVPENYSRIRHALAADVSLRMQPGCRSLFVPSEQQRPRGLVVLLHGFSAGAWQYEEYARRFAQSGYDVYVPRLLGHGLARPDGTDDMSQIPRVENADRWTGYATELAWQLKDSRVPVKVVGLSGGGAVALDMAARFPESVASATLLDPFLGPASVQARALFNAAHAADRFTLGQGSRLLGALPSHFTRARRDLVNWGREGHYAFSASHIAALSDYGAVLLKAVERAGVRAAPLQVISTSGEAVVDREMIERAVRAAGGLARNGFYDFPAAERVPHAMVDRHEMRSGGFDPEIAERVFDIILRFVDSNTPCQRPPPGYGSADRRNQTRRTGTSSHAGS